jgi:hypothetical protein
LTSLEHVRKTRSEMKLAGYVARLKKNGSGRRVLVGSMKETDYYGDLHVDEGRI